jgi:hypothetical protein
MPRAERDVKVLFYTLTVILGLFGTLAMLRTIERLWTGAGFLPAQLLIAVIALVVAATCLKKARAV